MGCTSALHLSSRAERIVLTFFGGEIILLRFLILGACRWRAAHIPVASDVRWTTRADRVPGFFFSLWSFPEGGKKKPTKKKARYGDLERVV